MKNNIANTLCSFVLCRSEKLAKFKLIIEINKTANHQRAKTTLSFLVYPFTKSEVCYFRLAALALILMPTKIP